MKTAIFIGILLFSSNVLWSQSQNALKFDGVDDHVNFSDTTLGNFGTSNFTIEFLVKYQQAPSTAAFVASKRSSCNDVNFWDVFILPNGHVAFELSNGLPGGYLYLESSTNIINCNWTHIAIVRVGTSLELYINGSLIVSATSGPLVDLHNSTELLLGKSPCLNSFAGTIDNFRIWNTDRSQTEIMNNTTTEMTGIEPNLILNCSFNQGVANSNNANETSLDDSSASNSDGTLNDFALNGVNSNWVDATPISFIDVQISCAPFTWINGNTYTSTNNTATHTLTDAAGCDSTVALDLTINTVNTSTSTSGITLTADQSGADYQWIDCMNGNTAISGETNQDFTATSNGDYAVIVTINGCSDTSACESITTVGLDDLQEGYSILISPNPSQDIFNIESDLLQSTSLVRVVSTEGRLVYESSEPIGESLQLNAVNWETGVYFLILETDKGKRTAKLVKK